MNQIEFIKDNCYEADIAGILQVIEGKTYVSACYYGNNDGFGYKDSKAFTLKKGLCYINEHAFDDVVPAFEDDQFQDWYDLDDLGGYDYQAFLTMAEGNEDLALMLFETVDWQALETLADEIAREEADDELRRQEKI